MTELSRDFTSTPATENRGGWKSAIKGLVQKAFEDGVTPSQSIAAEAAEQSTPTTEPTVDPVASTPEAENQTPPPGLSPMAEKIWRIKRAQIDANVGSTLPPDLDKPVTGTASEPLLAGYSVISNRTGEAARTQEAVDERARVEAAKARTASFDVDSIRTIVTAAGIAERTAALANSAFRRVTKGRILSGNGEPSLAPLDDVSLSTKHIELRIGARKKPTAQQHADAADRTGGGIKLTVSEDTPEVVAFSKRITSNMRAVTTGDQAQEAAQTATAATTTEPTTQDTPEVANETQ